MEAYIGSVSICSPCLVCYHISILHISILYTPHLYTPHLYTLYSTSLYSILHISILHISILHISILYTLYSMSLYLLVNSLQRNSLPKSLSLFVSASLRLHLNPVSMVYWKTIHRRESVFKVRKMLLNNRI